MELKAQEITPFQTRNENPLARVFGLPPVGYARTLDTGRLETAFMYSLTSNYADYGSGQEHIILDQK